MRAGALTHYGSIQTNTPGKNGDIWTDVRRQWAEITPIGTSKITFLSAQGSKATHLIRFREIPAVQQGQRFMCNGKIYQIVGMQHFIGDRQEAIAELLQ